MRLHGAYLRRVFDLQDRLLGRLELERLRLCFRDLLLVLVFGVGVQAPMNLIIDHLEPKVFDDGAISNSLPISEHLKHVVEVSFIQLDLRVLRDTSECLD